MNLTLSSPTGGATLGSPSAAVLTIVDDDPAPAGSLQFSSSTFSVNENGGNAVITITRTGGSNGAVGVTFTTSNGTAQSGSDYTAVINQIVSFANGDTANKTVNVPITNDSSFEGNETVNLTLSSPTGGATLGSPSAAVLTIVDDDPVGPTLNVNTTSVAPGGTVTATWGGIPSPSPTDWIGLYAPGAADTAYIDWIYVSCTQEAGGARASGSCPFGLPVGVGTYELRLLANDGYTRLATSNPVAVGP